MPFSSSRAIIGFVAGALSVLTFHQGMIGILHALGYLGWTPFPTNRIPPFGIPLWADLAFWGGVWGAVYAVATVRFRAPSWLQGILLGVAAVLVYKLVVTPLKGGSIHGGWTIGDLWIPLVINCFWGWGVSLLLPSLSSPSGRP